MPVVFPSIKPSERDYLPPEHPVTTVRSQNGLTFKRIWGSTPANAEMRLSFRNIHTDKAALIMQAWLDSKSGIDTLVLPSAVLSGAGTNLKAVMLPAGTSIVWTFAERPSEQAVPPIWSTVNVRLIGELRMN